ncbi:hypothetical protein [Geomonas agri]|uniref:hypothetical protein n=1 Tax=Geomonas agri TaxID=2873702 RepID=UPI001CD3DB2B|nr:hypothetical protein [Geomonas agri]
MTKVAERYDVSGSFLARICTRLRVPRPARGYWAMLAAGKKMKPVPLPEAKPGDELEWRSGYGQTRVAQFPPPTVAQVNVAKRLRGKQLPDRHPILMGAKEIIVEANETCSGLLSPRKRILPDIISSKATLDRALDVANALYLFLEKRGHRVVMEPYGQNFKHHTVEEREGGRRGQYEYSDVWRPSRATLVFIGDVAFGLTLFETTERVEAEYKDGKYFRITELPAKKRSRYTSSHSWRTEQDLTSGRLCLQVYSPYQRVAWLRQWREAKPGDFPRKLVGVVKDLETEVKTIVELFKEGERKAEIERQKWQAERLESQRREAERQRLQAIEQSHSELLQIIKAWGEVKRIEAFFEEAESEIVRSGDENREQLLERLGKARELVGSVRALEQLAGWMTPEERLQAEQERQAKFRW